MAWASSDLSTLNKLRGLRYIFLNLFFLAGASCVPPAESPDVGSPSPGASAGTPATGPVSSGGSPSPTLPADVVGHWYVARGGERITLTFFDDPATGRPKGVSVSEDAPSATAEVIDHIDYDAAGVLSFSVTESGKTTLYRVQVVDGVLAGRFAPPPDPLSTAVPAVVPPAYTGRIIGWRDETFSRDIVPRTWDVALDAHHQAVLRIDRTNPGSATFLGTLKPYATDGALDEQPSEDVEVERWDGQNLSFTRRASREQEAYRGLVTGRNVSGTATTAGGSIAWRGTRAEVLTHGIGSRAATDLRDWQARTRTRLGLLALGGNPAPLALHVTEGGAQDPVPLDDDDMDRDDDLTDWPQRYVLRELSFTSELPNPTGGEPLQRAAHGYVAIPTTPPPAGGYPVTLAINGHGASAYDVFDPQNPYWYGDSFARRGSLVVSVDIGHRPLEERPMLYGDPGEDDPATGNRTHPWIAAPGLTSDWEEDGERVWDAMRALDYALGRPDVNPHNVTAVGLSMGGAITDWVAALDPRIKVAIAAGNPSDLAVMQLRGNHACWRWQRGDAREFYDPGDLNAMVAPRVLVRETGKQDTTYSGAAAPFGTAKEVVRRAKPAFDALGGELIHYLHFDGHNFHVGQYSALEDATEGVRTPAAQAPDPMDSWSTNWLTDPRTVELTPSIFAFVPGMAG